MKSKRSKDEPRPPQVWPFPIWNGIKIKQRKRRKVAPSLAQLPDAPF